MSSSINLPTLKLACSARVISDCISASFFCMSCLAAKGSPNWSRSRVYCLAAFQQNSAAPITPHEIPYLAKFRHENGPLKLCTFGRTLSFGMKSSSIKTWPVVDARRANLPSSLAVLIFLSPFSAIKPRRIPCSSFAHITKISAIGAFVIHVLEPDNL